jgi:hypothetical protein
MHYKGTSAYKFGYTDGFSAGYQKGLKESADQYTKVATAPAGADGINPSKLSDNGPAHQIAVFPLAGTPSDNTSQFAITSDCSNCRNYNYNGCRVGSAWSNGICANHSRK